MIYVFTLGKDDYRVICQAGYHSDIRIIQCLESGETNPSIWPVCRKEVCSKPLIYNFRFVNEDRDFFHPGDIVEVVCDKLYSFNQADKTHLLYDKTRVFKSTNTQCEFR